MKAMVLNQLQAPLMMSDVPCPSPGPVTIITILISWRSGERATRIPCTRYVTKIWSKIRKTKLVNF